jgi:hypothetical protein
LPSTICRRLTGADSRKVSVWLRRSSAMSRIDSSGTTSSRIVAAAPKTGATMISVAPGGSGYCASCGCISRKRSSATRKM